MATIDLKELLNTNGIILVFSEIGILGSLHAFVNTSHDEMKPKVETSSVKLWTDLPLISGNASVNNLSCLFIL